MDDLLAATRAVLVTTPARWQSLTDALPAHLLAGSPAPGEWSALSCLQHLVDTEQWAFPVRVRAFLESRDFPAFDPDTQGTKPDARVDVRELAAHFSRIRTRSLEILAAVAESDLSRTARHAELGPVSLAELLHEWAGHDLMHTVQAERAVMQSFIRGTGPWRPYFADHDVEARSRA